MSSAQSELRVVEFCDQTSLLRAGEIAGVVPAMSCCGTRVSSGFCSVAREGGMTR